MGTVPEDSCLQFMGSSWPDEPETDAASNLDAHTKTTVEACSTQTGAGVDSPMACSSAADSSAEKLEGCLANVSERSSVPAMSAYAHKVACDDSMTAWSSRWYVPLLMGESSGWNAWGAVVGLL